MLYITKQVKRLALFFLDIIFPVECLGCQQSGQWLCLSCMKSISWRFVQTCPKCLRPNLLGAYCDDCYQYLDGVIVVSSYQDLLLKQVVKDYKYRFAKTMAEPLASLLIIFTGQYLRRLSVLKRGSALPRTLEHFDKTVIIPVSLSRQRQAWRGFNQAELLAKPFASFFNLEFSLDLKRVKQGSPQAKLNKQQRLLNIKDSFAWQGSRLVDSEMNKKNIILIDDLVTTGATLSECAKTLKANGAGEVWGLVLARN